MSDKREPVGSAPAGGNMKTNCETIAAPSMAVKEIAALHSEIIDAARMTLDKAIRIGELLTGIKSSLKHGQWLPWVKSNLPFDDSQGRRYMAVFRNRDQITNRESAHDLTFSDAYRLLAAPAKSQPELLEYDHADEVEFQNGTPLIKDQGITKKESSRSQELAAPPEAEPELFDEALRLE